MSRDQQQQLLENIAYQSWQGRGCPMGSPEVDWEHACRVLDTQLTSQRMRDGDAQQLDQQDGVSDEARFNELGSDEDTGDAQPNPFAAAQSAHSNGEIENDQKETRIDAQRGAEDLSNEASGTIPAGPKARRRSILRER